MKTLSSEYSKIKRIALLLILSFIAVFLLRLGYEVFFSNHDVVINYSYSNYIDGSDSYYLDDDEYYSRIMLKNVATEKISQKDISGQDITIDQKYEKTADMGAKTSNFQTDNQQLRETIKDNDAVIQSENLTGLQGQQKLTMTIGVMPDNFDDIVESIKSIGTLQSFTVNKEDKTAEYRSLLAEQETLAKTRDSYVAIKEKGGNIQDLLLLEDKILEVEKKLQNLGVNIGTYTTENSFCTINYTLNEIEASVQEASLKFVMKCAKRSFFWTLKAYILLSVLFLAALTAIVIFIALMNSIKKAIDISKTEDKNKDENKKNSLDNDNE